MEAKTNIIDKMIQKTMNEHILKISQKLDADVFYYKGNIDRNSLYMNIINPCCHINNRKNNIAILLDTDGGEHNFIKDFMAQLRDNFNYKKILIIVPRKAMSCGTLMCLGADELIMSSYATLGATDCQIPLVSTNISYFAPAYKLEQEYNELILRSFKVKGDKDELSPVERFYISDKGFYNKTFAKYLKISQEETYDLTYSYLKNYTFRNIDKSDEEIVKVANNLCYPYLRDNIIDDIFSHSNSLFIKQINKLGIFPKLYNIDNSEYFDISTNIENMYYLMEETSQIKDKENLSAFFDDDYYSFFDDNYKKRPIIN